MQSVARTQYSTPQGSEAATPRFGSLVGSYPTGSSETPVANPLSMQLNQSTDPHKPHDCNTYIVPILACTCARLSTMVTTNQTASVNTYLPNPNATTATIHNAQVLLQQQGSFVAWWYFDTQRRDGMHRSGPIAVCAEYLAISRRLWVSAASKHSGTYCIDIGIGIQQQSDAFDIVVCDTILESNAMSAVIYSVVGIGSMTEQQCDRVVVISVTSLSQW
jgi:hypothetical protein